MNCKLGCDLIPWSDDIRNFVPTFDSIRIFSDSYKSMRAQLI